MKESAPFLKMYSEYVQNFDNSINLINVYRDKNPRFAKIINDIQVSSVMPFVLINNKYIKYCIILCADINSAVL